MKTAIALASIFLMAPAMASDVKWDFELDFAQKGKERAFEDSLSALKRGDLFRSRERRDHALAVGRYRRCLFEYKEAAEPVHTAKTACMARAGISSVW